MTKKGSSRPWSTWSKSTGWPSWISPRTTLKPGCRTTLVRWQRHASSRGLARWSKVPQSLQSLSRQTLINLQSTLARARTLRARLLLHMTRKMQVKVQCFCSFSMAWRKGHTNTTRKPSEANCKMPSWAQLTNLSLSKPTTVLWHC